MREAWAGSIVKEIRMAEANGASIAGQITAGVFPARLTADNWRSGEVIWLLDIIAPTKEATSKVLMNFSQIAGGKHAHMHPVLSKLVDDEVLERMGA